jgi:site-specific recombinase XerD
LDEYANSGTFRRLDKLTQDKRRQLLDATGAEPVVPGRPETFASSPLSRLQTKHLHVVRDRKAHVPGAQVNRVKAIKVMFKWALREELIATDPACDLVVDPAPAGGHHAWTVDEVRQFEEHHPVGSKALLALVLLLWTGVRRCNVVRLGRQHVRNVG